MVQTEVMPAVAGQPIGKPGDPCVMVIFGAAGVLTRRKLIPALYNLARYQLLSREFASGPKVCSASRAPRCRSSSVSLTRQSPRYAPRRSGRWR